MKLTRQKHARQNLNYYKNIFKFHEPYLVLIDGTFCQAALKHNIHIKDHLSTYLNSTVQCCTTRCVLSELDLLGSKMFGAKMIAQRCQLRNCSHRDNPIPAAQCLKSLLTDESKVKYFIATQDPTLTKVARSTPGIPVLYVYQNNIVLEKPSRITLSHVKKASKNAVLTPQSELDNLVKLKREANLLPEKLDKGKVQKRKAVKGPKRTAKKKKSESLNKSSKKSS